MAWHYNKGEMYASANNNFKVTTGISAHHLGVAKYYFLNSGNDKLNTKYLYHLNMAIGVKNSNLIVCPVLYFSTHGRTREAVIGTHFKYQLRESSKYTSFKKQSTLSIGGLMRMNDAFIVSSFLEIANYAFGVSYDFNISKLKAGSNIRGGVEITLRYITPSPFGTLRTSHDNVRNMGRNK